MSHNALSLVSHLNISHDLAESLAEIGVQMAGDHPLVAVDGRIEVDLDLDDTDLDLDLDAVDRETFEAHLDAFDAL